MSFFGNMFGGLGDDQVSQALQATGSDYKLPTPAPQSAAQPQQAPSALQNIQEYAGMAQAAGSLGTNEESGIENSPAMGLVGKAAKVVGMFFGGFGG